MYQLKSLPKNDLQMELLLRNLVGDDSSLWIVGLHFEVDEVHLLVFTPKFMQAFEPVSSVAYFEYITQNYAAFQFGPELVSVLNEEIESIYEQNNAAM